MPVKAYECIDSAKVDKEIVSLPLGVQMIIYHPRYVQHIQDYGHPESPERLRKIMERLESEDLLANMLKPESAGLDDLLRVHDEHYINLIKNFGEGRYDMDTMVHEDTYDIALLSAGGAILGARYSYENSKPSFALLRPPGHHAGKDFGGGFCYFNNIAIASMALINRARKIAILDIDVHHGNGTSNIFYESSKVLYISTHQYGIYPLTGDVSEIGKGEGEGFTVNIPLTSGCGDATFNYAFEKLISPIISQFKPGMILLSIGVDSHYADLLGGLGLSSQGYVSLVNNIVELSNEICRKRIAFVLEGGYNVDALAEVVAGITASFYDREIEYEYKRVSDTSIKGRNIVDEVIATHKDYWNL